MPKAPKTAIGKQKLIHPNSRQASCIQRQANRDQRVLKSKADSSLKLEVQRQKLQWYQDNLDPNKKSYTKHEVAELTIQYMDRFDEEMEQITIVNSVGNRQSKQHQSRETAIRLTKEREKMESEGAGIVVPDLVNGKYLENFRNWTGEIKAFPNLKFRKSRRTDLKVEFRDGELWAVGVHVEAVDGRRVEQQMKGYALVPGQHLVGDYQGSPVIVGEYVEYPVENKR